MQNMRLINSYVNHVVFKKEDVESSSETLSEIYLLLWVY